MLFSSIKNISNILANKLIPLPSIDLQPTFIVPDETLDVEHDMDWCYYAKRFHSLNFSIDYHFDEITNTLEMIKQNFDFSEEPKITLKRFVLKKSESPYEHLSRAPKEIVLPDNTTPKGIFKKFVSKGPHNGQVDDVNLNFGCQMISLYMDYNAIEEELDGKTTPLEQTAKLLEIDEEFDHTIYGFQFFVTIKKSSFDKDEDPYVIISTDMFKIDISDDFTTVKCLKVNKEDYLTEEDQPDLEDGEIKDSSENVEFIKIADIEARLDEEVEKNLGTELSLEDQKNEEQVSHGSLSKVDDSKNVENTNPQTDHSSC